MIRKPNFFIVGAPRCGTTAMWSWLREHPEIFMAEIKGPHFFGKDYTYPWVKSPKFPRSLKEYMDIFKNVSNEKIIGEASDGYFLSENAANEIYHFSPSAKIIIMLRNPIELLYSLHQKIIYTDYEPIKDFKKALFASMEYRERLKKILNKTVRSDIYWRATAFYERVKQYLTIFGENNVSIIFYEDLKNNPCLVYKKILRFLNVSLDFIPKDNFKVINPNRKVRIRWLKNFLNYPPEIINEVAKKVLPKKIRNAIRIIAFNLATYQTKRQPLDSDIKDLLKRKFEPEVRKLSDLLGRDLSYWII